jgi:hypothetical protein
MDKGESKDVPSITLLGCQAATAIDGSVALVLHTAEEGAIAFEVTLQSLAALRQAIAVADEFLRRQPGRA